MVRNEFEQEVLRGEVHPARLERGQRWPSWLGQTLRACALEAMAVEPNERAARAHVIEGLLSAALPEPKARRAALIARAAARSSADDFSPGWPDTAPLEEQLLESAFKWALKADPLLAAPADALARGWATGTTEWPALPAPMPVLLVREQGLKGLVADLWMWRCPLGGAGPDTPLLVPAPAMCLVSVKQGFLQQVERVEAVVLQSLQLKLEALDWRIVWDLVPRWPGSLAALDGPSAGAALAVGALSLARERLPEHARVWLGRIEHRRAAITAALAEGAAPAGLDAPLGAVDALPGKLHALDGQNGNGPHVPVPAAFVARGQLEALQKQPFRLHLHPADTVAGLLEQLALHTDPEALYGAYPDVEKELQNLGGMVVRYEAADFVGREWLTAQLQEKVSALGPRGGVVVLEAPMGWGKTSVALSWVRASGWLAQGQPSADEPAQAVRLDGWVFARQGRGDARHPEQLSGQPDVLLQQLEACTRHRLGQRRRPGEEGLADFLSACAQVAQVHKRPVVLLIDAVDEAWATGAGIDRALPAEWPPGVVLVLTGRSPAVGTDQLRATDVRPVRRLRLDEPQNQADLARYVEQRCSQIETRQELLLDAHFRQAILKACDGYLFVAAGLLRERDDLIHDLKVWRRHPEKLPKGLNEYFEREVNRALGTGVGNGKSPRVKREQKEERAAAEHWLAWLATAHQAWTVQQVRNLWADSLALRRSDALVSEALAGLPPLQMLARRKALLNELPNKLRDLFGLPTVNDDSTLQLVHQGLKEYLAARAGAAVSGRLHALWGALAERALDAPGSTLPEPYALQHAPGHLAQAASCSPQAWMRAAELLQDIRPDESGYLNRLFDHGPLKQSAWGLLTQALPPLLQQADPGRRGVPDLVTRLRSLRYVLSDQHELVARGWMPLVAALYNRQAGRWDEESAWGQRLRDCAATCKQPWIQANDLSPDMALGALIHRMKSAVTCLAASPSGRWVVAGLESGESWVWSREQLLAGQPGERATRHSPTQERRIVLGGITCIAIVDWPGSDDWVLASGGSDSCTLVLTSEELRRRIRQREALEFEEASEPLLGQLATQHSGWVSCIALIPGAGHGNWVLASGSSDNTTLVLRSEDLGDSTAHANAGAVLQRVATRHRGIVTCIALAACGGPGQWVLASGSEDHSVHLACSRHWHQDPESANRGSDVLADTPPLGKLAMWHEGGVEGVALLASVESEQWLLASKDGDEARILSSDEYWHVSDLGLLDLLETGDGRSLGQTVAKDIGGRISQKGLILMEGGEPNQVFLITLGALDIRLIRIQDWPRANEQGRWDVHLKVSVAFSIPVLLDDISVVPCGNPEQWIWAFHRLDEAGVLRGEELQRYAEYVEGPAFEDVDETDLGGVFYKHGDSISDHVLVAGNEPGEWALVSGARDRTVRVFSAADLRLGYLTEREAWTGTTRSSPPGELAFGDCSGSNGLSLVEGATARSWVLAAADRSGVHVTSSDVLAHVKRELANSGLDEENAGSVIKDWLTRNDKEVTCVAITRLGDTNEKWLLAFGAEDCTARVWTITRTDLFRPLQPLGNLLELMAASKPREGLSDEAEENFAKELDFLRNTFEQSKIEQSDGLTNCWVGTRHTRPVTSLALCAYDMPGRMPFEWVLASGSKDGETRVVSCNEMRHLIGLGLQLEIEENSKQTQGCLATRHDYWVTCVALSTDAEQGRWSLASGCVEGKVRTLVLEESPQLIQRRSIQRAEFDQMRVLGGFSTRHRGAVASVALLSGSSDAPWVVSAGRDGTVHAWPASARHLQRQLLNTGCDIEAISPFGPRGTRQHAVISTDEAALLLPLPSPDAPVDPPLCVGVPAGWAMRFFGGSSTLYGVRSTNDGVYVLTYTVRGLPSSCTEK